MKDVLYILRDILRILEPYKEEAIKASSAYWEIQKLISEVEKLVFAFPSDNDSGMTLKQYAAIHLKVPRSGDEDIDAMIRESRRAEFAGQALAGYSVIFPQTGEINPKSAAEWCREMADAMLAELEEKAGNINDKEKK
jgi:hypothetical protein